jgi:hypothetical protein
MLPSIAEQLQPTTVVFIDAVVPTRGHRYEPSQRFVDFIATLPEGALLPPWHDWWGDQVMKALVPNDELRRRLADDMPRVPREFYADAVQLPPGWPSGDRWRYLQLSPAYDDDAALARSFGWPTAHLYGHHLDIATRPAEVCDLVLELVA